MSTRSPSWSRVVWVLSISALAIALWSVWMSDLVLDTPETVARGTATAQSWIRQIHVRDELDDTPQTFSYVACILCGSRLSPPRAGFHHRDADGQHRCKLPTDPRRRLSVLPLPISRGRPARSSRQERLHLGLQPRGQLPGHARHLPVSGRSVFGRAGQWGSLSGGVHD